MKAVPGGGNNPAVSRAGKNITAVATPSITSARARHGTALADKTGAKDLEHTINLQQHPPETVRIFGVVRSVPAILVQTNRLGNFVGQHIPKSASAAMTAA
jgi:hypothetical protein